MIGRKHVVSVGALIVLLCLALLGNSVTYGRYRDAVQQDVTFSAKTPTESGVFSLTSANGWQTAENGMAVEFTLSFESDAQVKTAFLRLTATEALSPDVQITLSVDGATYAATAQPIAAGSALHAQMGDGYCFRFLDEDEELRWTPNTGAVMRLTVGGRSDAALLRLTAVEA